MTDVQQLFNEIKAKLDLLPAMQQAIDEMALIARIERLKQPLPVREDAKQRD